MALETATRDWSDAITLSAASMLQAVGGRLAVSIGTAAPSASDPGTILEPGATALAAAGDIRIRAVTSTPTQLHHQAWPA